MRNIKIVEEELKRVGRFNGGKLHKLRRELKTLRGSNPKN